MLQRCYHRPKFMALGSELWYGFKYWRGHLSVRRISRKHSTSTVIHKRVCFIFCCSCVVAPLQTRPQCGTGGLSHFRRIILGTVLYHYFIISGTGTHTQKYYSGTHLTSLTQKTNIFGSLEARSAPRIRFLFVSRRAPSAI